MNENNENKKNSNKILIIFLIFITVVAIGVTVWALFFRESEPPTILAPDYAPLETEGNADTIPGDNTEGRKENEEGSGSVSMSYSPEATIDLSDGKVTRMFFANPGKSNQDMVVQIVIQDLVIVQSGTLNPGKMVTKLDLLDDVASRLTAGIYEGKYVILYYDPATGEKAVVNTEMPITITVQE